MASGSTERTFRHSADDVWAILGDFSAVARWYPGVEACEVVGDERTITTAHGVVRERLVSRDGLARRFTYRVVDSAVAEQLLGVVQVHPDPSGCRVEWSFDVVPDDLGPRLVGLYASALDGLDAALT